MFSRAIVWVTIVGALVLWLSGANVPGWLWGMVVLIALTLGVAASRKQKRMERDFVRAWWRAVSRRI